MQPLSGRSNPLTTAFPAELASDDEAVLAVMPDSRLQPHASFSVAVEGQQVSIPGRLCNDEPPTARVASLSSRQQQLLHCLYSRHCDGMVRQRHLEKVVGSVTHPRFHLHFTPTGSSWLNLVEHWFAELTNKQIRRGVHKSVQALEKDIRAWITAWNTDPKPYVRTKTGDEILERLAVELGAYTRLHQYIPAPPPGTRPRLAMREESWRRHYPLLPRLLFVLTGTGPAGIGNRITALRAAARQLPPAFLRDVPILATPMTNLLQHGPVTPVWRPVTRPDHQVSRTHPRHP